MAVTLSIIVPAYNAVKYLDECIQSILSENNTDYEIILVDDGSTDGTSMLCDYLAEKHTVIKVFHTENRGVPMARNLGLEHASGRFLGFVDADDVVMPNMFGNLIKSMQQGVELAACRFERCHRDDVDFTINSNTDFTVVDRMGCAERILRGGYGPYVYNKLFRKDIIDQFGIRFRQDSQGAEDQFFTTEYISHCNKAVFLESKLYFYIITEGSITSTFRNSRIVTERYISLPRSWRYTAEIMKDISTDLMEYAQARATMFYQTVLRKLKEPEKAYIEESVAYIKSYRHFLLRYQWGIKYYLSSLVLCFNYSMWSVIFRKK